MTTQTPQPDPEDAYFCGYLLGMVDTVQQCAQDGCPVCRRKQESRDRASDLLALLEMPEAMIERVLVAARAQGEVMTTLAGHGNVRVEYTDGIYKVTP